MKRIEFIAPVAAMRGNLGETQRDIVYPTHDNRAFDGPEGERNTARNYQPIIVGAKRAYGKTYFSVRTKTTSHLTKKSMKSMALLGGANVVFSALKKNATLWAQFEGLWGITKKYVSESMTFNKWLKGLLRGMLENRQDEFEQTATSEEGVTYSAKFINPFTGNIASLSEENPDSRGFWKLDVDTSYLNKFAAQLYANNSEPYVFSAYIDGIKFYWSNSEDSAPTTGSALGFQFNNGYSLSADLMTMKVYIYNEAAGEETENWLLDPSGNYVGLNDTLIVGGQYKTTLVAP